jgi:hypothetical protein
VKATRRAGFALGCVALVAAAYADADGNLQARLLLWIAAATLATPALLHALVFGLPAAQDARRRPAELAGDTREPVRVTATVGPARRPAPARQATSRTAPALQASARLHGDPPAPHRRPELTR